MPDDVITRLAARVVLLDNADRLLMLRIHDPSATCGPNPITADFWLLVGGGLHPGETYEEAAYREVVEETGIRDVSIGRCVWTQDKVVSDPHGRILRVLSRFYLGRVTSAATVSFAGLEPLEASTIVGYRWFTHREILTRETEETFLPPGLGGLLTDVLEDAMPTPVPISG